MSASPNRRRRSNGAVPVVGACLFAAAIAQSVAGGAPAFAQVELEPTPTSVTAPANAPGVGATRGIARRPATQTQATTGTVAAPSTTAPSPSTSAPSPTTSTTAGEGTAETTIVQAADPVAEPVPTTDLSTESPGVAGSAENSLIPPPVIDESRTSGAATAVSSPPPEPETNGDAVTEGDVGTDTEAGSGWFGGANVADGGLVSAVETSVATPTTAPTPTTGVTPTTVATPTTAAATPTTAASSPGATTADTTSDKAITRDVGRGRTSRLLEVAAVIAGVIGLSSVPVLLARLVRARGDDESMEQQAPA